MMEMRASNLILDEVIMGGAIIQGCSDPAIMRTRGGIPIQERSTFEPIDMAEERKKLDYLIAYYYTLRK